MPVKLIGKKVGMTRVFSEDARSLAVTVLRVGPCVVTQLRTPEKDGYAAVQLGFDDVKPRRSTIPMIGHDAKAGTAPKRTHREFRVEGKEAGSYTLGQTIGVSALEGVMYVDVIGVSKGKGFQGVMKRHHFKGMFASHGTERKHRSPGSIGGGGTNRGTGPKVRKGRRMAGHMGDERVVERSMEVVRIDPENNILLVKGAVPGAKNSVVEVRPAVRLNTSKARKAAGKKK